MVLREILETAKVERKKKAKAQVAKKFAIGTSAIAAIGVVTGIFIAPKSGRETRENMKKKVTSAVDTIKETVHEDRKSVV